MGQFNLADYATVDQRIAEFYADWPDGSIRTHLSVRDGREVIFVARVFKTREDVATNVYSSGWAREVEGSSPVTKTSHLETAETSAVGRALANMGYSGHVNGKRAPRPSREEMAGAAGARKDRGVDESTGEVTEERGETEMERLARNLRQLAADVDAQRRRTAIHLTAPPAAAEAEDCLQDAQCSPATMKRLGALLLEELKALGKEPDASERPSYENATAPPLEDESDDLPFD